MCVCEGCMCMCVCVCYRNGSVPMGLNEAWDRTACMGLQNDPRRNDFRVAQWGIGGDPKTAISSPLPPRTPIKPGWALTWENLQNGNGKPFYPEYKEQVITSWHLGCKYLRAYKVVSHVLLKSETKSKKGFPWEIITLWFWGWRWLWGSVNCKIFLRRYLAVRPLI